MRGHSERRRPWIGGEARYRTVDAARIVEHLLLGGWAFDMEPHRAAESRRQAVDGLDRLVGLGLPFGGSPTVRTFDPVEVVNFVKWTGLLGLDEFWLRRDVATGRRLVGTFAAQPAALDDGKPARVSVTLRRTFNLANADPAKPLRLRLPMPIEDGQLRALSVEHMEAAGLACRISPDRCCIEVRGPVPTATKLTVTARFCFVAGGDAVLPDEDRSRYLRPAEGLIEVTDAVGRRADELTVGAVTDEVRVSRFWTFMLDDLICGAVHYDQVEAAPAATDWVLATGWFDCTLGAALLVALCRSKGIPARMVSGYLLYPAAPTYHYWAEIWLEGAGWRAYDLLTWGLSAGGRDPAWRDVFAGRLDPRMKTQSLPLHFTGAPGVPFPPCRHLLMRRTAAGAETSFCEIVTGSLIYRDEVEVSLVE